jgi:glycosyltransferase involved in cell wall biosynthesis
MLISIVTVSYNSAATIADTLRSVAAQEGVEVEHIIIDGASRDDTLALVERHGVANRVVVSEKDRGIYDAMNKGLALARGEFVGFLNSDDYFIDRQALASLAAAMRPDVDAVLGDIVFIDEARKARRCMRARQFNPALLRLGLGLPHPAFYVRTALLRQIGGFHDGYRIAADFDLVLRLFKVNRTRLATVSRALVAMRIGGASTAGLGATALATREMADSLARHGMATPKALLNLRYVQKALEVVHGRMLRLAGHVYAAPGPREAGDSPRL